MRTSFIKTKAIIFIITLLIFFTHMVYMPDFGCIQDSFQFLKVSAIDSDTITAMDFDELHIRGLEYATVSEPDQSSPLTDAREVVFISSGATFSPVLTVSEGTRVSWRFADGTSSNSAAPHKNYENSGIRKNFLLVSPWSGLIRVNLGYDGGDGGADAIEHVPPQNVIGVHNLQHMAPYLRQWCSSHNDIPDLNFDNLSRLDTIECFWARGLKQVSLRNTFALRRACFEECRLNSLDLSGCPNLEDLRAAKNMNYIYINFGRGGDKLWHICIRDNPQIKQILPMEQFQAARELFIWNTNQGGGLPCRRP